MRYTSYIYALVNAYHSDEIIFLCKVISMIAKSPRIFSIMHNRGFGCTKMIKDSHKSFKSAFRVRFESMLIINRESA